MIDEAAIDSVMQDIVEAFSGVPRPDLSQIHPLGCCEEHEPFFEWYRNHSWQEFKELLPSGYLDSIEFFTLHPSAYHYFTQGLLLATAESLRSSPDWFSWDEDTWVRNLCPSKNLLENFRQDYLPLFSSEQREAVRVHLRMFNDWYKVHNDYGEVGGPYGDKEMEFAIDHVWVDEG